MADVESLPVPAETADATPRLGPPAAPGGLQMLDPRVVSLDRLAGAIVGVVISAAHLLAIAVVLLVRPWPGWALLLFALSWFPVAALLVWLAVQWPRIDYRHWRYRLDGEGIEIWSGVVWRQAVMVPRSRVQHIDVSQGPLERSHGLATLSIHTAGTQYSKVDLRGLDHSVALAIRDALLPKDAEPAV
jgi:membrane protein YdbS with pleckstrin-like domain